MEGKGGEVSVLFSQERVAYGVSSRVCGNSMEGDAILLA